MAGLFRIRVRMRGIERCLMIGRSLGASSHTAASMSLEEITRWITISSTMDGIGRLIMSFFTANSLTFSLDAVAAFSQRKIECYGAAITLATVAKLAR
jgi:hypothetical protein